MRQEPTTSSVATLYGAGAAITPDLPVGENMLGMVSTFAFRLSVLRLSADRLSVFRLSVARVSVATVSAFTATSPALASTRIGELTQ